MAAIARVAAPTTTRSATATFIAELLVGSPRDRASWKRRRRSSLASDEGGRHPLWGTPPSRRSRSIHPGSPASARSREPRPVSPAHVHAPHALTDEPKPAPPDRVERRLELGAVLLLAF